MWQLFGIFWSHHHYPFIGSKVVEIVKIAEVEYPAAHEMQRNHA